MSDSKSCGLVKGAIFNGPHSFTGKIYEMPDDKIVILHYDSVLINNGIINLIY